MTTRFVLIDALGLVYRAFYAIPPLTTSRGETTHALLGFVKMLGQLTRLLEPAHQVVVFDGGIPPERRRLLAEYKAQRPPMPDTLKSQLPLIEEYLEAAGIAQLRREGKEADDLLASIAVQQGGIDEECCVVTSDKDLMQIVTGRIVLVQPGKTEVRVGPAEVVAKTGVRPDQIVDWLAMVGDTSDNIPGVPGVGAKTAARLLAQWGSLPGIWNHLADVVPERMRAALKDNRELAERNQCLMRLETGLEAGLDPATLRRREPDRARLLAFYERMEFHALAQSLKQQEFFQ